MFKDPWIPRETSFRPICINMEKFQSKVKEFISPSSGWDITKLNNVVPEMDIETIKRIPINSNLSDKIIWHYDRAGKYSVKSEYKLFMNSKINEVSSSSNLMGHVLKRLWESKNT